VHRVVLDSNVIVSGTILRRGVAFAILEVWRGGAFQLVSSRHQQAELIDALKRPTFSTTYGVTRDDIAAIVRRLRRDALTVSPVLPVPINVRDPDDEPLLGIALAGDADFLVTGTKIF
jgi:putative PIN family toxin of toxin-antitoxin system